MAQIDIKLAGEQLTALGPTDEHRQQFGKTFLGSLMGQTIALIGMVVAPVTRVCCQFRHIIGRMRRIATLAGAKWPFRYREPLI